MHFEFLKTEELTPALHREIEAFLDRQSNSHPFQFPEWTGEPDRYCAILRGQGEIRWFALCGVTFPVGKWLRPIRGLTVYRGPVCDDAELTLYGLRQLLEKSKKAGFAYIEIAPDWVERTEWNVGSALSRDGWQVLPDRRSSLRLDLAPGNDELWQSFRKTTRYEIRRSEHQGVVIRFAQDDSDLQEFQRIYFEMANKKNFPAVEPSHLAHVLRWIVNEKGRGALLLAFKEGTLLGGTLVVRAASRSWYVFGATTKDDRLSAGHLLQWHAIRWAKDHGCADYDFGGYREDINTGPALFKRGFCQAVVQFSPPYRYPLDRRLCSVVDFVTTARSKWLRR
jgi:Acetyltransferase (GNAT) domain